MCPDLKALAKICDICELSKGISVSNKIAKIANSYSKFLPTLSIQDISGYEPSNSGIESICISVPNYPFFKGKSIDIIIKSIYTGTDA